MRSWCPLFLRYSLLVLVGIQFAQPVLAQVRGTIFGPGVHQYPIALAPLRDAKGGTSPLGVKFVDTVERNLVISGLFRTLPRESYIEDGDAAEINFDNWSVIGAITLVKGSVEQSGGEIVLEARLYDVSQRRSLTGRRYRGGIADLPRMANRFSDEIMAAVTGARGPFDSRIAFVSNRGAGRKDVYVMSVAGDNLRRVTSGDTLNLSPSWAPDGQSLLLTSYTDRSPNLFTLDLASSSMRRLSDSAGLELGGVWSPRGQHLAVALENSGDSDIAILGPDGSLVRRLTDHWAIDVSPSWSPDGRQIAFCSSRAGSPQIYIIDADGGAPRRVTQSGSYNTSPSWSPQGDRLAYTSRQGSRFQVFTVAVDGSDVHQVTKSTGDSEDPTWSPDGRYLLFSSTRGGGTPRLYVADAGGLAQVELTAVGGGDTSPTWSGWID